VEEDDEEDEEDDDEDGVRRFFTELTIESVIVILPRGRRWFCGGLRRAMGTWTMSEYLAGCGKLNTSPCLHRRPINLVVSQGAGRDD
jgi:hypothetical protein